MKTHAFYLIIIAILGFFALPKSVSTKAHPHQEVPHVFTSAKDLDKSLETSSGLRGVFYAYINPNDPKLYIVAEYQPELEYREIGSITYPFIKGTDKMLVALNTIQTKDSATQWIWEVYNRSIMKGYQLDSIYREDIIPAEYQLAVREHNKVHPNGKDGAEKVIVRALFKDSQYVRKSENYPPSVDFDQF